MFIYACRWLDIRGFGSTLGLALFIWLGVSVPMAVTDGLFIKLHPMVVLSHSLSWLTKLIILASVGKLGPSLKGRMGLGQARRGEFLERLGRDSSAELARTAFGNAGPGSSKLPIRSGARRSSPLSLTEDRP